jgi:integrase
MPVSQRRKNGRRQWCADYEDHSRKRVQRFFATKELAEEHYAQAVLHSRQRATPHLPTTITFAEYTNHWLELQTHLKTATRISYEQQLNVHLDPVFGGIRLRDLERGRIKAFLAQQLQTRAKNTVRLMHATLRVILNAAVDDGIIIANPADKLGRTLKLVTRVKVRQEEIKAMTRDQRDRFLTTAVEIEPWWMPMWAVEVRTGLRPGETYALEEEDLELDAGHARISRTLSNDGRYVESTPKGNRARTIDLSAQTIAILRAHIMTRKAEKLRRGWKDMPKPLFCSTAGTYAHPANVRRAFYRVTRAAGMPHFSPHGLRHTFASLYLTEATSPDVYYLSRMLGHATIGETVDTYGRWLPANRKGALDVLDDAPLATNLQPTRS